MATARKQQKKIRAVEEEPGDAPEAQLNGVVVAPGLIDVALVRDLIAAVDQSGIDTLEISRSGTRIRISKSPAPLPVSYGVHAASPPPVAPAPPAASPAAQPPTEPQPAPAAVASNLFEVKSPMVGTFFRAPAPEAPPYVEPGTHVSTGQTLCILEAMKLMNELPSEVDGIVREIHVENGSPVEYGQLLFRIERTSPAA